MHRCRNARGICHTDFMMVALRSVALWVVLALVPLHAVAAPALQLLCDVAHAVDAAIYGGHGHGHGTATDAESPDATGAGMHHCCLSAGAIATIALVKAVPGLRIDALPPLIGLLSHLTSALERPPHRPLA